jgi:iron complex transport system ATP-binding protein
MSPSSSNASCLLSAENASVRLGGRSFGSYDLRIAAGERVAILGPSGAGKSTLLKLLARDYACATGQVLLHGQPLSTWDLAELSRQRAVLPQSHEVAFALPVDLVIALGRCARRHDPQLASITVQAAQLACAEHLLGRRFDTLSGGEKARVQLARIFAQLWDAQAGLLLVDEPLAALDPGLQFDLADAMSAFAQRGGHALVAILHDVNHALQGFERLILVKDAAILADIACNAQAQPWLEQLYGVRFSAVHNAQGELALIAQRRSNNTTQLFATPREEALCKA